jgi:hypothetical protein
VLDPAISPFNSSQYTLWPTKSPLPAISIFRFVKEAVSWNWIIPLPANPASNASACRGEFIFTWVLPAAASFFRLRELAVTMNSVGRKFVCFLNSFFGRILSLWSSTLNSYFSKIFRSVFISKPSGASDCVELNGDMAGSNTIVLGGTVGIAEFSIAGSGTVRAFDCTMDELECKIAGSGDIEASVVNKIKAEIAGSGSVKYKGDPQDIQKKVMGSGKIEKVE